MHAGYIPRNHPSSKQKRASDDAIDDRETPPCIWDPLHAEFRFTLDAAANHHNAKCDKYCALTGTWLKVGQDGAGFEPSQVDEFDGLHQSWAGHAVYCNPPFTHVRPWVEKAWDESAATVVLLLPNNRAEQPFFSELIEPYRDRPGSILTTRNLARRRPFLYHGTEIANRTTKSPPFGVMLVIWDRRRPRIGPGH
jgi:hypothetical protein